LISFAVSSASAREAAPVTVTVKLSSGFACGNGDSKWGEILTREVSSARSVLPFPLAFIRRPVLEMTADRASVLSAIRIFGSGPAMAVMTGVGIEGVAVGAWGHSACTRLGRLSSFEDCWVKATEHNSEYVSNTVMTRWPRELSMYQLPSRPRLSGRDWPCRDSTTICDFQMSNCGNVIGQYTCGSGWVVGDMMIDTSGAFCIIHLSFSPSFSLWRCAARKINQPFQRFIKNSWNLWTTVKRFRDFLRILAPSWSLGRMRGLVCKRLSTL